MKAVIMAGGQGTRFWPASRQSRPKQFLNILGKRTMLQETMARLDGLLQTSDLYVVCQEDYVGDVKVQAPGLPDSQIIIEPLPRDTAACIGLAASRLHQQCPEEVMVVLPADHAIDNLKQFRRVLKSAEALARDDWLVALGVHPTFPATGYGYLERGPSLGKFKELEAFRVLRFIEKPDSAKAQQLFDAGGFDWNSGIFVWKSSAILQQISQHMPDLHSTLDEIHAHGEDKPGIREAFGRLPRVSIDFGVMEKAEHVAVIPAELGWNDVGSWRVLSGLLPADEDDNVGNSLLLPLDARRCLVHCSSPEKLVALIGVEDLVVVETPDALLICPREQSEQVQKVVDELKARKLNDFL